MNRKPPTVSRFEMTAPVLLIAAVVWLCFVNFRPDAWNNYIAISALQSPRQMTKTHEQLDSFFGRHMSSGNIWVRFEGFRPELEADAAFMTWVYYRGNYAIYPRHIYVSPPSTVVNNAKAMVPNDVFLNGPPAKKLGIHWMVIFSQNRLGQISTRIQRLQ